ncbi:hypothetical protein N5P37_004451, partial [Trichoderma harzianum]
GSRKPTRHPVSMETYLTCSLILGVKSRARTPGPDLLDYRATSLQAERLARRRRSVDGFGIDCALAATGLLEKLQPDAQLGRQAVRAMPHSARDGTNPLKDTNLRWHMKKTE